MAKKTAFKDTAVGKVVKVALWAGVSAVVSVLIQHLADLAPESLAWLLPSVNALLVGVKNLADRNVKNF